MATAGRIGGPPRPASEPAVEALRWILGVAAVAASYYAAAQVGYTLKFTGAVAAIVWLPVGVGISFLYFGGTSLWPGVLIGDLLANQYQQLPTGSAIGQSIGNVLEVVIATVLLRRLTRGGPPLASVRGVCGTLTAIFVGTAVSATIGPFSLRLGGVVPTDALPHVWRTWWLGDTAGALLVVPLALAWSQPLGPRLPARRIFEGALMLLSVVVLSDFALRSDRPLSYVVFPALIWGALRFGPHGGTLAVAVTAAFTLWKTAHHAGPFIVSSMQRSTTSTQLYLCVAALSTLLLAAVVSERETFARGLAASRARLVGAADRERRRLEQNLHDGARLTLTMLAAQLAAARRKDDSPELAEAEARTLTALEQLRELAHGLHPTVLTDLGLADAIRSLADESEVPVRLAELPAVRLDEASEAAAYHVVAEALANAARHAGAGAVTIRVGPRDDRLEVEVVDDGVGGADVRPGSGLQSVRDRVEAASGTFALLSIPGRGTRVRATVPAASRNRPYPA